MSTTERDKFLSRYELLLKIFSIIFEVICLVVSIILLANSEENQTNLIVGLVLLLAMPLVIWLMYSLSMVLVSFFYDVKMIRNRLIVIEERTRLTQKTDFSEDVTLANDSKSQKNEMKSEEQKEENPIENTTNLDDQEVDEVIRILNQGK